MLGLICWLFGKSCLPCLICWELCDISENFLSSIFGSTLILFVFSSACVQDQISGLINLSTFLCSLQRVFWILPTCPQVDLGHFAQSGFPTLCAWEWRDWEGHQQQSRPQVGGFWKKSVNLFKTVMSQKDGDWQNYVPETLDETNDVPETLDETFNPKQT